MKNTSDLIARVLGAARQLFFAQGYYATTTREVASKAGTSESGVFRIVGSKYELLMAVYNDCWAEVNVDLEHRVPSNIGDPRDEIVAVLAAVWELYDKKPLLMSFIIINTGNTDTLLISKKEEAIISDENVRYIERLEALCEKCVDERLVDSSLSAPALREGLLGLTEGVLIGWYLADKAGGRYGKKIGPDEAVALLKTLLYSNPQRKTNRKGVEHHVEAIDR